ncbi:unnamed protein product, partial [Amoebophrya sp. A25]
SYIRSHGQALQGSRPAAEYLQNRELHMIVDPLCRRGAPGEQRTTRLKQPAIFPRRSMMS